MLIFFLNYHRSIIIGAQMPSHSSTENWQSKICDDPVYINNAEDLSLYIYHYDDVRVVEHWRYKKDREDSKSFNMICDRYN